MCRTFFTLVLGISLLAMAGCKRSNTTYTGPNGEKMTVNEDGSNAQITFTGKDGKKTLMSTKTGGKGEVTITGADGETMQYSTGEKGAALPKDFPKDVPVYSGGVIMQNMTMPNGILVMIKSGDATDKIKEFYENSLKDQGWVNETSMESPQGSTLIYKKDDRTLSVIIATGDETMIHLTISKEKN